MTDDTRRANELNPAGAREVAIPLWDELRKLAALLGARGTRNVIESAAQQLEDRSPLVTQDAYDAVRLSLDRVQQESTERLERLRECNIRINALVEQFDRAYKLKNEAESLAVEQANKIARMERNEAYHGQWLTERAQLRSEIMEQDATIRALRERVDAIQGRYDALKELCQPIAELFT